MSPIFNAIHLRTTLAIPRLYQAAMLILAIACWSALSQSALGDLIVNIDLQGYRGGGGGTDTNVPPTNYVGSGTAGGGTVFNAVFPTSFSDNTGSSITGDNQTYATVGGLQDSYGGSTGVNFSIGPVGVDNESTAIGSPSDPQNLFNNYVFNNSAGNGSNATFQITGLTAGRPYEVYLYAGFSNAANLGTTLITGGTVTSFSPTGIFNSGNTVLYDVNANGSGVINGTMGSGTQIFAGLTVVPEPGSMILVGGAAVGLACMIQRRRWATRRSI